MLAFLRFKLFQAIEWSAGCLQRQAVAPLQHYIPAGAARTNSGARYLWVFTSTIGELHAIQPFLIQLLNERGNDRIVILTDHPHYTEPFLKVFPQALVIDHGVDGRVEREVDTYSPDLFILAEIPCALYDAPCRFSFRVIYKMKRLTVPVVAVNCWLYGEKPGCRMDAIEKFILGDAYLSAIDLFTAQTEEVREQLIALGVEPAKVEVTGNIKFDALNLEAGKWLPPAGLKPLLKAIKTSGRPVIVAGCVTNISEQDFVLDAFQLVLKQFPEALLVLTPRHPENNERMAQLSEMLDKRKLGFSFRSKYEEGELSGTSVLVLDTMGELKYMYAAADVCFVGLNHNVLEPLAANKPVIVTHGWEKSYPSYPVYEATKQSGLVVEVVTPDELAYMLIKQLNSPQTVSEKVAKTRLQLIQGASEHNIKLVNQKMEFLIK